MAQHTPGPQDVALRLIREDGFVYAGFSVRRGRVLRVSASALLALGRKGLVEIVTSPDGGIMARAAKAEDK